MSTYRFSAVNVFVPTVEGLDSYLTMVTAPVVSEFVTNSKTAFGSVAFITVAVLAVVATESFEKEALAEEETP